LKFARIGQEVRIRITAWLEGDKNLNAPFTAFEEVAKERAGEDRWVAW
jgi:hypothetical protein